MVKAKAKGNKYETIILKDFRKVYPDAFRTMASGSSKDDEGDIIAGPYCVECKHHKDFTDGELEGYFKKVAKEAENRGKIPLVVFRVNRRKDKVMFQLTDYRYAWMYWDDFLEREREKNT